MHKALCSGDTYVLSHLKAITGGGAEAQEGGGICVLRANSLHCTAETNTVKQLYPNLKKKLKKIKRKSLSLR